MDFYGLDETNKNYNFKKKKICQRILVKKKKEINNIFSEKTRASGGACY